MLIKTVSISLILSMFYLFNVSLEKNRTIDLNHDKNIVFKNEVLFFENNRFTGKLIERFPNQKISKKTQYKNGLKDGLSEEYAFTGALRVKWNFSKGKKHGVQKAWFIEGPKNFEQNYKSGLLHGVSTEWYLNGNIYRQRTFKFGKEIANKVFYESKEIHTNYVKKGNKTYGIKNSELCMDLPKDGEVR